jgi:hypothetical protein
LDPEVGKYNNWLKSDNELSKIQSERETSGHETHPLDREHLKRDYTGTGSRAAKKMTDTLHDTAVPRY